MDCQSAPDCSFHPHFEQRTISGPEESCIRGSKLWSWAVCHSHHPLAWLRSRLYLCLALCCNSYYLISSRKDKDGMEKSSSLWAWHGDSLGKGVSFLIKLKAVCFSRVIMNCRKQQLLFWVAADPGLMIWRVAPDLQTFNVLLLW